MSEDSEIKITKVKNVSADEMLTLNEPVYKTLWRDLVMIAKKIVQVLLPFLNISNSKDWDLWGPLLICLILAITLSASAPNKQHDIVFAIVFIFVWLGSIFVSLNIMLLGGKISFFQSVCVMGYSIFPLTIVTIVLACIGSAGTSVKVWIRLLCVVPASAWSVWASYNLLGNSIVSRRKFLGIYPLFLFYVVLSWMVTIQPFS